MSKHGSLGDILNEEFIVNFFKDLERMHRTRSQALEALSNSVRVAVNSDDVDIDDELMGKGFTLPQWIENQITPLLDEVFPQ